MLTQISFTADEELKDKAMQKAKEKGLTLKSVLIFSMEAFADGKMKLGIVNPADEAEEMYFNSPNINEKAEKLARLKKIKRWG